MGWGNGDYFESYKHDKGDFYDKNDGFEELVVVRFWWDNVGSFGVKSNSFCENVCLGSCGCVELFVSEGNGFVQELG